MGGITWTALALHQGHPATTQPPQPHTIHIPLDSYQPGVLRWDALRQLEQHQLPVMAAAKDLMRLATAVFACDVSIPRASAFDAWTRHIRLEISVEQPDLWNAAHPNVEALLTYLSGDNWEIRFHPHPVNSKDPGIQTEAALNQNSKPAAAPPDAVCLLSGGVDSFIGAADKLGEGKRLTLVSHHGAGSASHASPAQDALKKLLEKYYSGQFQSFSFNVDPRRGLTSMSESTTRSRSLVFLSLGTLVAAAQQAPVLYIPENGLITLNLPLTYSRLGSSSTRTTHPHTLYLFQELLNALALDVKVKNPYRHSTKGEMLSGAQNPDLVKEGLPLTMSCAHPNVGRFKGKGISHCGYCVPCIIRAAAEHQAGFTGQNAVTTYVHDVRLKSLATANLTDKTGRDVRAFQIAILRAQQTPPSLAQVCRSGPLSSDPLHLSNYVEVYKRGLQEVDAFLKS